MPKATEQLQILDTMLTDAVSRGLLQREVQGETLDGRTVRIDGRNLVNFGSCSYLGLETDERLRQGAIDAVNRYGVQFSSSRAYASAPLYTDLEHLLAQAFGAPTIVTPNTTLAHLSALPVLVAAEDAVLLDQQVHHSVQMAVNQLRVQKVHVEILRHNRMDDLDARIAALSRKHPRVWYLADGVYSMYGDFAPFEDLQALLARHEQLHLYLDDAHGTGWHGTHGRGLTLERMGHHPRLVVATSLSKSFAAGGGALIFPNAELCRKVRTCGGPLIFSGPLQSPVLGACVASARLHLSDDLPALQAELRAKTAHCHQFLAAHDLPVTSDSEAPIHFVGMGLPRVAYRMVERLRDEGFHVNVAMFPAVPMKRAGVRFTTTRHQRMEDITALVEAIAHHHPRVVAEEGGSREALCRLFNLAMPVTLEMTTRVMAAAEPLAIEHHTTIDALDAAEWDALLGDRGTFGAEGLRSLERAFGGHAEAHDNWAFHYFVVRRADGRPVLATFFTDALWKDDLLSTTSLSRAVERRRETDPGFLVSRTLGMGCPLTEGDHLYLDRHADWRGAFKLLLEAVAAEQERVGANAIALRDLPTDDVELEAVLLAQGFVRGADMDACVLRPADAALSRMSRRHQRESVTPWNDAYEVELLGADHRAPTPEELARFHRMYLDVKQRNLALNTFALPRSFFEEAARSPAWELLTLRLKASHGGDGRVSAVVAAYRGDGHYVPHVGGLDYAHVEHHGAYRQLLRHAILRGEALGASRVLLGVGAALEKRRFGAHVEPRGIYVQVVDSYHLDVLDAMKASLAPDD